MAFRAHALTKKITECRVMGNYGCGWEEEHSTNDYKDAVEYCHSAQQSHAAGTYKIVNAKVDNPDHGRFKYGMKVRTHPATDAWMQGLRVGYVRKVGHKYVTVAWVTDTRITRKFTPEYLEPLDEADNL